MKNTSIVSFERTVLSGIIFFMISCMGVFPMASISEADQDRMIDGTYLLSLPMPGGAKESTIVLVSDGEGITGTMSAPGNPSEVSPVLDGRYTEGRLTFSVKIGRITYLLDGSYEGDKIVFDMTTLETIPLDAGRRLSGKTGEITGTYQVPVYSPGGIKENKVELVAGKGVITGEMYSSGDSSASPVGIGGAPGNMGPPSAGGPSDNGGAPDDMNASTEGKRDLNTFYDSTYEANNISLFTKTAQGSVFHFTGTVDGDTIRMTMHVTDKSSGIEANKK